MESLGSAFSEAAWAMPESFGLSVESVDRSKYSVAICRLSARTDQLPRRHSSSYKTRFRGSSISMSSAKWLNDKLCTSCRPGKADCGDGVSTIGASGVLGASRDRAASERTEPGAKSGVAASTICGYVL